MAARNSTLSISSWFLRKRRISSSARWTPGYLRDHVDLMSAISSDHGFVFTDEEGEPLKMYAVLAVHKHICEEAGLPETFMLKVSRLPCASAMINDGVPLKMVSDRLGHASVAITADVYGVTDEDRQREVSERIEQLFGSGKK